MTPQERMEEICRIVKSVPKGRATSYGCVGQQLSQPLSGLLIGRRLADLPEGTDVPWWRVVRSDGVIVTFRKDPKIGMEQVARLEDEGIPVDSNHQIDLKTYGFWFD